MDIIDSAAHFAIDTYAGARRKGDNKPMIVHAMEAAVIAASLTDSEEVIAAAVLHDVAEDRGVKIEELRERFGGRVAELVQSETEDKRRDRPAAQTWRLRKQEAVETVRASEDMGVKILFLSDKLSNMRSLYTLKQQLGDKMWEKFNQKDPEEHHWYYRSISDALTQLSDTLAWKEYDRLVAAVFEEQGGTEA